MNEKEQLWYARFLEYTDSGMSQRRWCLENQLPVSTFRYWYNKFTSRQVNGTVNSITTSDSGNWFQVSCQNEVMAAPALPAEDANTIRFQFRKLKMEFPAEIDSREILQIVKGLMKG